MRRANRPAFDLFTAKLRRPLLRPGVVRRSLLIERLARDDPRPIVSVVAPPGYGKTTLLAQWAERKLGASTRSQAVTQARELGLLGG